MSSSSRTFPTFSNGKTGRFGGTLKKKSPVKYLANVKCILRQDFTSGILNVMSADNFPGIYHICKGC